MTTKTIRLVRMGTGWTWAGNEEGFNGYKTCILSVHLGFHIGNPERRLKELHLFTMRRKEAIRQLDNIRGSSDDVSVIKNLAKRLNMIVSKGQHE